MPFHGWAIYRLRLIFTADVCGAWLTFGGLAAQLNHLSAALHLSATESISTSLIYDQLLSAHMVELARSRYGSLADPLITLLSSEQRRFKTPALSQSVKDPSVGRVKKEVAKEKEKTHQRWIRRAGVLAKLESERGGARVSPPSGSGKHRGPRSKRRGSTPARRSMRRISHRSHRKDPPRRKRRIDSGDEPNR